jgi:signal transduction histidine kinase
MLSHLPSIIVALVFVFGFLANASAQDLILDRALLQDHAGTMSIDEAAQATFTPAGQILNAGYTQTVHWLRLRVKAPDRGQQVELRIRPTYLDEVLLFEPDPERPGQWLRRITGDKLGDTAQDRSSAALGFSLALHAPLTTVYLRLQTTSTSLLHVEALMPNEARVRDVQADIFLVVYLGFMVALMFWAANEFLLNHERVLGMFLVYQLCYSVYSLTIMGFLTMVLPRAAPGVMDMFTNVLVCLTPLVSLVFHRVLLGLFLPPRAALRVLDGLILLSLAVMTMLLIGHTRMALQFNAFVILLAAPTFVALAFAARQNAAPGLRVIRTLYSLQGLSLLFSMLPFLGWIRASEWSLKSTLLHGFISASLMFLLLHLRSRKLARDASQAKVDLVVAREQLALKNQQKRQQERFMAMLTHELKTPVAVIRMALGKLQLGDPAQRRARRALTDMTAIVEHCQQADQLEQQQLVAHSAPCDVADMLDELKDSSSEPERLHIDVQSLPPVTTDPQLLRIVLGNLIDNAFKYAPPDSPVAVLAKACIQAGVQGVSVTVCNQVGPAGLPDAHRVFEKYYRSLGAHRKTGSGLGLYLVKNYMQLLGGQVTYSGADDQVEFTLWLPC